MDSAEHDISIGLMENLALDKEASCVVFVLRDGETSTAEVGRVTEQSKQAAGELGFWQQRNRTKWMPKSDAMLSFIDYLIHVNSLVLVKKALLLLTVLK